MKKVSKCFADSKIIPIFVPAILEKTSGNALFDILHDRQKRALDRIWQIQGLCKQSAKVVLESILACPES